MAIKAQCGFSLAVYGDGTSTTLTILLSTGPFVLVPSQGGDPFQPTFSLSALTPTGTNNLAVNGPGTHTVSASIGLLGEITFTFDSALDANAGYTISGYFEF